MLGLNNSVRRTQMTNKEYAHKLAVNIRNNPNKTTLINVANDILQYHSKDANQILSFLEEEIGGLRPIMESYDNKAQLSYIAQLRQIIKEAQKGKK